MPNKKITDLDTFSGTPGSTDYLAIENSADTYKIPANEIKGNTYTGAYGISVNENQISLDVCGLPTDPRQSSDPNDVFAFQTSGGSVYKVLLGTLIGNLLSHIRNGAGITIQPGSDVSGPNITLSAPGGASYTAGDGIDITNNEVSVKLGEGLELDENTGSINVAGGDGITFYRVRYHNPSGTEILHREYVEHGENAVYQDGTYSYWSETPGGNPVAGITENITHNLDLYGVIIGSLSIDFSAPLYERYGSGTSGIDSTYTADMARNVLVINAELTGEAVQSHTSGAQITTTGAVFWSDSQISDYTANTCRDCNFIVSVVTLEAGDTITMSNAHSNNHSEQIHQIFDVTDPGTASREFFETVIDAQKDNTVSYTPEDDGVYMLLAIQTGGSGSGLSAQITGAAASSIYAADSNAKVKAAVGEYQLTSADTVTLTTSSATSYVSKLYGIWKL